MPTLLAPSPPSPPGEEPTMPSTVLMHSMTAAKLPTSIKKGHGFRQPSGLLFQGTCRYHRLLNQQGVLVSHSVDLHNGFVNIANSFALFICRGRNLRHNIRNMLHSVDH